MNPSRIVRAGVWRAAPSHCLALTCPSAHLVPYRRWGKNHGHGGWEVLYSFPGCNRFAVFTEELGESSVVSVEVHHPSLGTAQGPAAPRQGDWNEMILEVPPNTDSSVILQ